MKVEITNNRIPTLTPAAEEAAENIRVSVGNEIARIASAISPVYKGFLQIGWKVENDRAHHVVFVYSDEREAPYQEFGTHKMPAQPTLKPAAHRVEKGLAYNLARGIKRAIE